MLGLTIYRFADQHAAGRNHTPALASQLAMSETRRASCLRDLVSRQSGFAARSYSGGAWALCISHASAGIAPTCTTRPSNFARSLAPLDPALTSGSVAAQAKRVDFRLAGTLTLAARASVTTGRAH
jgi:hypothetical protein